MKKIIAILLVLCLCPLCAWAEAPETPAEPDYTELIQAICDANQLEALFSRHESLQFLSTDPAAPDGYDMIWETQDAYYQSFADYFAVLEKDQIAYQISDEGEDGLILMALYDPAPFFTPYTIASSTPDDLVNPAHERPIDSYEEDGRLYMTIEYDESFAQKHLEENGLEYTGQVVMARMTLDASSYEFLAYDVLTVENGEEDIFHSIIVSYDRPEPIACLTLRAAFERADVETIDVSFVIDPDTDHEIVKTMTVPANTACNLISSAPYVFFYDQEQTVVSGWDRMSDVTIYVYTNPDESLVQRFQELYSAAYPDEE